MLDLNRLAPQVERMAEVQAGGYAALLERAGRTRREIQRVSGGEEGLRAARDKALRAVVGVPWLVGIPLEAPASRFPLPPRPPDYAALATDGSQITPDRHEVALCFLINIATVSITYGSRPAASLTSDPQLFYEQDDIYESVEGKRSLIDGELLAAKRTGRELGAIGALIEGFTPAPLPPAVSLPAASLPAVALLDGTLIMWSLSNKPERTRRFVLDEMGRLFFRARERGIPVLGYISSPRAGEAANLARVLLCPMHSPDCRSCTGAAGAVSAAGADKTAGAGTVAGSAPCAGVADIPDAFVWSGILAAGERSALFASRSKILDEYDRDNRICFFYLKTEVEVARVEVPLWVAETPALVDLVHAVAYDQACKGGGYPVALDEAHKQAVVRGPERRAFFDLVSEMLARRGVPTAISPKHLAKRVGVL